MAIKRHIFLIIFILAISLSANGQLVFDSASWDFGSIRETDGRVSHTFTGENRGEKPLVILDVVTTCGCTVPQFSRQPIKPGDKTQITVTFDPTNRPGSFSKDLGIYSSERRKVATLTIQGSVAPRPKSIEEQYPVDAGGGLRLGTSLCAFSYIYPDLLKQSSVTYANTSTRTLFLDLNPQQTSGLLTIDYPRQIAPGEQGEINLSYLNPSAKFQYGTQRDLLEVSIDGRSEGILLMVHAIGIDNPKDAPENAPVAELSENILKFGPVKRGGSVQQVRFTLRNTGGSPLIVRAVESNGKISTNLAAGQKIPAGGAFTAEVALDPRKHDYGVLTDHLMLIVNDPVRPMRRVRVTAIIEE